MRSFPVLAAVFMLLAASVSDAVATTLVKDLPDKGTVALAGIVDQVSDNRNFVLRDTSGTITVRINSGQSLVLKPGEKITIVGAVISPYFGFGSKRVDASDVQVQKDLGSTLTDTVAAATGVSVDTAKPSRINELPSQGMVRLLGTVDNVVDAKTFALKDPSGTVDVKIQSDENVALKKGSEVTVIGYVDSGLLGKTIRATRVIVSDNAIPSMGGG